MRSKSKERKYTSARERAEKQNTGFAASYLKLPEGLQLFQPKAGTMLIDILPFEAAEGNPWADAGNLHWERTYYAHRGIGPNGDTFICPRMTAKERCPICEFRLTLMKKNREEDEEMIRDLSPKQRQLFNVINLKDPDKGVQVWDISYHLFGKALDARLRNSEEQDEWEKFFFLEGGFSLRIGFAEKSYGGFTFLETESIDFRPRKRDYDEDILEDVHCLDELLVVPDYAKLKDTFLEAKAKDEDEEDEEDEDRKSSKAAGRRPAKDEDDDEEDEPPKKKSRVDEDDDWEDEKDDRPAKKRPAEDDEEEEERPKHRRPPKEDEEDDEDRKPTRKSRADEEEDEEEEDRPKKKAKSPKDDEDWDDFDKDDRPSKRARADEDEEEEDRPRKKAKAAKDEEDD